MEKDPLFLWVPFLDIGRTPQKIMENFQISFGTIFWPMVPEYIDEAIQALIEKGVPFVCSLRNSFAFS